MNGSWSAPDVSLHYCISILPQDHFEHTQQSPRSARIALDECHRHSASPDWPLPGGRILPCTLMHALHACATYLFFVSHPTGKTPCVMVEHAMLTTGGVFRQAPHEMQENGVDAHRHSTSISEPALLSNAQVKKRVSSLLRSIAFFLHVPLGLKQ